MTEPQNKLVLKVEHRDAYTLVTFRLDGIIGPEDLKNISNLPDIVQQGRAHLGVVLSGRGPIWLYGFLAHYYHPCTWVAMYDPRLQGGVIVQSHNKSYTAGDIFPVANI